MTTTKVDVYFDFVSFGLQDLVLWELNTEIKKSYLKPFSCMFTVYVKT